MPKRKHTARDINLRAAEATRKDDDEAAKAFIAKRLGEGILVEVRETPEGPCAVTMLTSALEEQLRPLNDRLRKSWNPAFGEVPVISELYNADFFSQPTARYGETKMAALTESHLAFLSQAAIERDQTTIPPPSTSSPS